MKTKTTFKSAAKTNWRAIKLLYKKYPSAMLSTIIYAAWVGLAPYPVIYLSARIIAALSAGADKNALIALVAVTLSVSAAVGIVTALLKRWYNREDSTRYYKAMNILSEKMLDLDFVKADDTATRDMLNTIKQNQNGGGHGLYSVQRRIYELISSLVSMAGGIALTVTLFITPVPDSAGGLTALNSPLITLAVIAVMLAVTALSPVLETKGDGYWAKNIGAHRLGNRLFGFFGYLGSEKKYAADMRFYRQYLICKKYNCDKTGTFNSKGPFAKYARGAMGAYMAAGAALSAIFMGAAYVYVCLKAWAGAFGAGEVAQYVAALTTLSSGLSGFIAALGKMKTNAPFLDLVFEFLDIPSNMYQGSLAPEKRSDGSYEIEFKDVSFRYPAANDFALKHVNVKFRAGEKLAVVGMNGSGKTTFIKLLCRLYDPTEGEILLNGTNIKKYDYYDYMNIFSVVFQDFKLFSLPLGENVACGKDVDEKRALKALDEAGFNERYEKMPKGLNTYLYKDIEKDGVDISGGEAQKIAIARALYKDSPFIILDEPTAALDPIAESEIYEKFNELVTDKTAIYISHRLSSCKFCDEIAVFDKGRVVQKGSHEALLSDENGKYYELWHAQAQYYGHTGE